MKENDEKKTLLQFDVPTPREIVRELDKYIISQNEAKRAVAIALRNRGRRKLLPDDLKDEVAPKNIIMIGPTGVGKTEIAKRLSNLAGAPFIKVEATKYTEIGYVGRDVEAMVRDLTNISVNNMKKDMQKKVEIEAAKLSEERLLDLLFPLPAEIKKRIQQYEQNSGQSDSEAALKDIEVTRKKRNREKMRQRLLNGELEDKYVEISVKETTFPIIEILGGMNMEDMDFMLPGISNMMPKKQKRRKVAVREARKILINQESEKLIDMDKVIATGIERVENMGIIFIDEIDKIIGKDSKSGPDVSREGVQRDLLPIVEGTNVMTKYGVVKTHHILFIAAGAFHANKPSDLIPEMQGRFPIRVELKALTEDDFKEILTKPKNALIKQYLALLKTEGLKMEFQIDAIEEIAKIAFSVNNETENIGARRLHTILEKLLEEISFNAPELKKKKIVITAEYVMKKLKNIAADKDLSRYIL